MVTIGRKCLYQNNILARDYYLKLSDNPFICCDEIILLILVASWQLMLPLENPHSSQ